MYAGLQENVGIADWPEDQRGDAWEPPVSQGKPGGTGCSKPIPFATVPRAEPFPVDVFPESLATFIHEGATALSCPPDYLAHSMLVTAGGAIGASRALEIKPGWTERPCLYGVLVGGPGSAKSPALKLVVSPVYEEQRRLQAAYNEAVEEYDRKLSEYEQNEEDYPKEPIKPTLPRVYVADTTCEALAPILLQNPRGLLLIRDELMAWVASLNQYKPGGKGSDRQFWLAAWAGEPHSKDRVNQDGIPIIVPHPFIGVIGGLPPDLLPRFRDEKGAADGFLDRLLFAFPDELPAVGESWRTVSPAATAAWGQALTALLTLNTEPAEHGGRRPHYVELTRDARSEWETFTNDLADKVNDESFPSHLRGPYAKLKGYCARLALVVHCLRFVCEDGIDEHVDGESMRRAARLVDYYGSHANRVMATMDANALTADGKHVLRWIRREKRETFSKRDAHRALCGSLKFKRADDLDHALTLLETHYYIRVKQPEKREGSGRPPSPLYEVNPWLWQE